ncbi:hypothetical protein Tco_1523557 [Tanacetum coccineum]
MILSGSEGGLWIEFARNAESLDEMIRTEQVIVLLELNLDSEYGDLLKGELRTLIKDEAYKYKVPIQQPRADNMVSPWKGVVRFGKKGKLAPRFVGPFEIIEKVGLWPIDRLH